MNLWNLIPVTVKVTFERRCCYAPLYVQRIKGRDFLCPPCIYVPSCPVGTGDRGLRDVKVIYSNISSVLSCGNKSYRCWLHAGCIMVTASCLPTVKSSLCWPKGERESVTSIAGITACVLLIVHYSKVFDGQQHSVLLDPSVFTLFYFGMSGYNYCLTWLADLIFTQRKEVTSSCHVGKNDLRGTKLCTGEV